MTPRDTVTVFGIEVTRDALIVSLVFAGLWLLALVLYLVYRAVKRRPFTAAVPAEVRYLNTYRKEVGDRRRKVRSALYEYSYDGETYLESPGALWTRTRKVGDRVTVYVNPEDPRQILDRKHELVSMLPSILLIMLLLAAGAGVFYLGTVFTDI